MGVHADVLHQAPEVIEVRLLTFECVNCLLLGHLTDSDSVKAMTLGVANPLRLAEIGMAQALLCPDA